MVKDKNSKVATEQQESEPLEGADVSENEDEGIDKFISILKTISLGLTFGIMCFIIATTGFFYLMAESYPLTEANKLAEVYNVITGLPRNQIIFLIILTIIVALLLTGFYTFMAQTYHDGVELPVILSGMILNSLIERNDRKQALDYQTQLDDFRLLIKKEEDPEKKKDLKEQEKALRKEYDAIVSDNLQREDGSFVTDWRESLLAARRRLLKENERLLARNRANLTYGIIAAVLGVLILGVILIFSHSVDSLKDLSFGKIAFYYLSRVSITIIIEIVAIFFLKLYALTEHRLEKNKNEMTNIELRLTSGLMSLHKKSTNKFDSLADDLAKEERNFVLGKNETSAITDIDKLDIDRIVEIATKIIKATK